MIEKKQLDTRFTLLFNAESQRVFRYIYSHVRDKHIATDITQSVFLKYYERIGSILEGSELPYLITIAKNALIDYYRTKKEYTEFDEDVVRGHSAVNYETESPINESVCREDCDFVSRLIDHLPEPDSDIVRLRAIMDSSYEYIAHKYHMTEEAVRKRYSRALVSMKSEIVERYPDYVIAKKI